MNTQDRSPGVYVQDVKPLNRPLSSPSLSTFGMFGRLSVGPETDRVVAFDSFSDFLNRHKLPRDERGPLGSLILLLSAMELPWQTDPRSLEMRCESWMSEMKNSLTAIVANPAKLRHYGLGGMLTGPDPGEDADGEDGDGGDGESSAGAGGGSRIDVLRSLDAILIKVESAPTKSALDAALKALEEWLAPLKERLDIEAQLKGRLAPEAEQAVKEKLRESKQQFMLDKGEAALRGLALTAFSAYFFFLNSGRRLVVVDTDLAGLDSARHDAVFGAIKNEDVGLLAAPGSDNQSAIRDYCGRRDDTHPDGDPFCFGILDGEAEGTPGEESSDESVGYYAPWVQVEMRRRRLFLPPSPFVAGVIARTDSQSGPHFAPAGTDKGIAGATGLFRLYTEAEAGRLNKNGVNCLRIFPGGVPVVFGCRTRAKNPLYRHVPVVRLLAMIRKAVKTQLTYLVHKPNTSTLRKALVRDLYTYLEGLRRLGALEGDSAEKAFRITCNEDNNPPAEVAEGKLNVMVEVAPVRPAEFIIVEVSQMQQV